MTTDTVAPTASTPPASPAGGNKVKSARRRLIELVGCIALVGILVLLGPPAGLSSAAWTVFALYLGAMAGLMLRPVPESWVIRRCSGVRRSTAACDFSNFMIVSNN